MNRFAALFAWRDPEDVKTPEALVQALSALGARDMKLPTVYLRGLLLEFRSLRLARRIMAVLKYQTARRCGDIQELSAVSELPKNPSTPRKRIFTLLAPTVRRRDSAVWLYNIRPRPPRPSIQPELKPRPKPKPKPVPPPKPAPAPPAPPPRPRVPRPSKRPPKAQEELALAPDAGAQVAALQAPRNHRGKFCHVCFDIGDRRPANGACPGCLRPHESEELHAQTGHTGVTLSDFAIG